MPEYGLIGTMDNKASPYMLPGLVQHLTLNGELNSHGQFKKRRGIATTVTIAQTFGTTAPFKVKRWTDKAGATALIAVGANAVAFVNPFNGYLYARDGAGLTAGAIYDDPTSFASVVGTGWGLDTPATPPTTVDAAGKSRFLGGQYAYAITLYDEDRNVESQPTPFLESTTAGGITDQLEQISGPSRKVVFTTMKITPEINANFSGVRRYRNRIMTFPRQSTGWQPVEADPFGYEGCRLIIDEDKSITGASPNQVHTFADDYSGQPRGPFLTFSNTVVPFNTKVVGFDGKWFYGENYTVVFTNPGCPETYAAKDTEVGGEKLTPVLGTSGEGVLVKGTATIDIPTDLGTITGFAAMNNTLLILCELGAWRVLRLGNGISYGVAQDPLALGCVSQATIANSPQGVWWLSPEGIVLWNGQNLPELVTAENLDINATETVFAADLSGACAAFNVRRNQYVVMVPESGGDQFVLVVQADMPLNRGAAYTKWVHSLANDINGMGYDPTTGEVIFRTVTDDLHMSPTDGVYEDRPTGTTPYKFSIEAWIARDRTGEIRKVNPVVHLKVLRSDVTTEQTVTVSIRGAGVPDIAAGTEVNAPMTLPINSYILQAPLGGVSGEAIHITATNQDDKPMSYAAISVGQAEDEVQPQNV